MIKNNEKIKSNKYNKLKNSKLYLLENHEEIKRTLRFFANF